MPQDDLETSLPPLETPLSLTRTTNLQMLGLIPDLTELETINRGLRERNERLSYAKQVITFLSVLSGIGFISWLIFISLMEQCGNDMYINPNNGTGNEPPGGLRRRELGGAGYIVPVGCGDSSQLGRGEAASLICGTLFLTLAFFTWIIWLKNRFPNDGVPLNEEAQRVLNNLQSRAMRRESPNNLPAANQARIENQIIHDDPDQRIYDLADQLLPDNTQHNTQEFELIDFGNLPVTQNL